MNPLKKVSKSIKAFGSSHKLHPGPDAAEVNLKPNADADANEIGSAVSNEKNTIDPLNSQDSHIFISVREPWKWVIEDICVRNRGYLSTVTRVETAQDLPSGKLASVAALAASSHSTTTRSSRRRNQKGNSVTTDARCILRLEIVSNTKTYRDDSRPWVLKAFHCTSQAFDGLDDKDELARTLRRCRCEDLGISPHSQLINWDVTKVR